MRSHKFINSLLYLEVQLMAKESNAKKHWGIRCFFVLFIDNRYMSQVIHIKPLGHSPRTHPVSISVTYLLFDSPPNVKTYSDSPGTASRYKAVDTLF